MHRLALGFAGVLSFTLGFVSMEGCKQCVVGSESCDCTGGGACDPGLECLSGVCVNAGPDYDTGVADETGDTNDTNDTSDTSDTNDTNDTTGDGDTGDGDGDGDDSGDGIKLDTLNDTGDDGPCVDTGCKKVDMLFAMDGSASMIEEINALKTGQAFLSIVSTLENLNCGGIDYRIGVTGDNDNGWVLPGGWADPNPWFDSETYTAAQMSVHFQAAATAVGNSGGAPLGCEHVLSSAVNLLASDNSGFLRDDALLVLVLMSDVDDYGWYDQVGGNSCGIGCQQAGQSVANLQASLVGLKDGDTAGVSAIVIAGDPMMNGGVNFCGQPQSCGTAFHAERLYEFALLQDGTNGFMGEICDGPQAVPTAVESALSDNIDLACQEFQPEG